MIEPIHFLNTIPKIRSSTTVKDKSVGDMDALRRCTVHINITYKLLLHTAIEYSWEILGARQKPFLTKALR